LHVLGQRVRVHRNLGMVVRSEKLRAFHADGSITESCAFGGAGNDTNVLGHALILQRPTDLRDVCIILTRLSFVSDCNFC
jgi:hypothetical protein